MTHMVELRYIGGDLADLMCEMRTWLDYNQIEAEEFYHSSSGSGLAVRVGFAEADHAAAFAEAFDGWVECDDPQGARPHWTMPPRHHALRGQDDHQQLKPVAWERSRR
jgi:hypothetical protein